MNMADALDRAGRFFGGREAVVFGHARLTYGELCGLAARVAGGLAGLGIARGDRVALHVGNRPEYLAIYYGCLKIGAVVVSLSPRLVHDELAVLLADSSPSALFCEAATSANLPDIDNFPSIKFTVGLDGAKAHHSFDALLSRGTRDETYFGDPDDPATIIYTSGTTGVPKGVVLSHGNLVSNTVSAKFTGRMGGDDRSICYLPLGHSFAQNFIMNAVVQSAGTLVLLGGFDAGEVVETMRNEGVTRFYGVPPVYIKLLETPGIDDAMRRVTYCFSAASTMPSAVAEEWRSRFGLPIHEGWGLTETSPTATYNHEFRHKAGTVGTPIMNVDVKIVGPTGEDLPQGERGEILVRGPNVMLGYFGKPAETAEAFYGDWLRTGDVGYLDDEGYLVLVDRIKDMINSSGLKIWPREVEEVLYRHPNVRECAIIGIPHPVYGETAVAVIALKHGQTSPDELRGWLKTRVSDYKIPRIIEFMIELPKNSTGKISKLELKRMRGD